MRKRIISLAVLAAVLATALFGLPLAAGVAHVYMADQRHELQRLADEATLTVSATQTRHRDPVELPAARPDITLGLYEPSGRRIAGSGPAQADTVTRGALRARVTSGDQAGDVVVAVPVAVNESVTAVVRAAAPRSAVYRRIGVTWLAMLAIGAAAILLTWLLARRYARRLAQPLEEMSAAALRLGEGDFSIRTRRSGIPEIDTAGASLDATAERLGTLIARERAFSADASHQLRTPLTGLRLRLEAAQEAPDGTQREALRAAIAAVDALDQTIVDLLALARDIPRERSPLDLPALLEEVRQSWHSDLAGLGRPLRLDLDTELPECAAATPAIRQILSVLVDNAAHHGSGTVTVKARDANGALAIDVTDEGPAITADPAELFRRRTTSATGHGIGLAMARSLAEAEGGRLQLARPEPPTFTLLLPGQVPPQ